MSQKRILDFFGGSSVPKVSRLAEEDTHVGDETANGIAIAEEDGDNGPLPVPLENGPAVALPAAATNNGSSSPGVLRLFQHASYLLKWVCGSDLLGVRVFLPRENFKIQLLQMQF